LSPAYGGRSVFGWERPATPDGAATEQQCDESVGAFTLPHASADAKCAPRRSLMAREPAGLGRKVKTALDETRILILGAHVLLGFQLNGVFQEAFAGLSATTRLLGCLGQILMVISIGLLIAPSMQHRIVERGEDTNRI